MAAVRNKFVFLLAIAALICAVSAAADAPAEAVRREFDLAKAALAAGDLPTAESEYKQTIAIGLRQLGNLSLSEAQLDRATELLDQAVKINPDNPELQLQAAMAWFRKGNVQKARELAQQTVSAHPENASAHNVLGRIDLFRGDTEGSIDELTKAVSLQDDFETAYFLGIAYLKAKKMDEAAALFDKLQAGVGESAAAHVLFGRAYILTHYPAQAVAELRKAVRLDPKYPRAHALLGYASLDLNGESFYSQARTLFEQELKIQPNDYLSLMLLGITTTNLRDYPAAESALNKAIALRPNESDPYLYLGETYTETKRLRQAVDALQKYLKLVHDPEQVPREVSRAYYLLGQDLLHLGQVEEGKKALLNSQRFREAKFRYDVKHIFDEKPAPSGGDSRTSDNIASLLQSGASETQQAANTLIQSGVEGNSLHSQTAAPEQRESVPAKKYREFVAEILASSYNDLGVMQAKSERFAEATEYFSQAAVWNPSLSGLDRNWGFAAYRAENFSEAIPPLERQLVAHPDDAFVRQLLGMSYYMTENYARTVDVLRPLFRTPPDDPGLLLAWGTALVRTRQSNEAAAIFRQLIETNATNPSVHFFLGQAYAQQQDYPNALNELKKAIELDPKLPEAHYYTGLVYLHQGDFSSAAQEFEAELQLRPGEPVTQYHLAFTMLSEGQVEEATRLLREVVKTKPDYELAHFELGRALLQTGDIPGAIENLEQARKLAPEHDAALFQLSQAYRRAGRLPEAEQTLAAYRKLIEESRAKRRESLETEQP